MFVRIDNNRVCGVAFGRDVTSRKLENVKPPAAAAAVTGYSLRCHGVSEKVVNRTIQLVFSDSRRTEKRRKHRSQDNSAQ